MRPFALAQATDLEKRATWLRHGGTWFVGVDALPNDARGAVDGGPPLSGRAFEEAIAATGVTALHRAQVSVTYPGYPQQDPDESDAAHRFRRNRDAAHLDGLLPEGLEKRRHLREPHAYILGVALTEASADAAPLVVWDGSQRIIGAAFAQAFERHDADEWPNLDVTEIYKAARAKAFAMCRRVEIPLTPGESVRLQRHVIHGVAPWGKRATAAPEGRAIAYFRPCLKDFADWL